MPSLKELEAAVERYRTLLAEAETALQAARKRGPQVGDFARSTLTNFYGRITRVNVRPSGQTWVEITPYLAPNLPGRNTLDLFDAWELIDEPAVESPHATPSHLEVIVELTSRIGDFRSDAGPQAA
jgi:hypothetical protein